MITCKYEVAVGGTVATALPTTTAETGIQGFRSQV